MPADESPEGAMLSGLSVWRTALGLGESAKYSPYKTDLIARQSRPMRDTETLMLFYAFSM